MTNSETIILAGDHAGYVMKEHVRQYLEKRGLMVVDASAPQLDPSDDYPLFGFKVAQAIADGEYKRGILMCGTGIGISIAANRYKGVRAALCTSPELAHMAREHNDSNILVLGGRTTTPQMAEQIVDAWLDGTFAGDRHARRVEMLDQAPAV
jgi:RpiB/LacA/LacB family sugar-phosphate isomerase